MKRKTKLLVLAGGFGTRLQAIVSGVPKPLAPVLGQPFLHYLLENWARQGVNSFTLLLHHRAEHVIEFVNSIRLEKHLRCCEFQTLVEPTPLGTGGAVAYAVQQSLVTGPFLVANADTWLSSGVTEVSKAKIPAMAVVKVENSERYGSVKLDGTTVTAFIEKQDSSGSGWINAGLYRLHANMFKEWDGKAFSLEKEVFSTLADSARLYATPLETDFIDIGIPEDYLRFCRWIESEKSRNL